MLDAGAEVRWAKDEIDGWCESWAAERRKMLGIVELQPRDRIGKLRSTLGAVREDGEGASQGTATQSYPEVYTGIPLLVHRAWTEMNPQWRQVLNIHYVLKELTVRIKSKEVGLSTALYWRHLHFAKNFVHSFVTISTKYEMSDKKVMQTHANPANDWDSGLAYCRNYTYIRPT